MATKANLYGSLENEEKTKKLLLWLGIISMFMIFAGLTSAFVVRQVDDRWLTFDIPSIFYYSTALLLISSITMNFALVFTKKEKLIESKIWMLVTLLLGLAFIYLQMIGWNELVKQGVFFVDSVNVSGSFFYVITGTHLMHLFAGIIVLIFSTIQLTRGKYTKKNYIGLKLTAIFWHFLDLLWLYLFAFLLFIG
jgi:cytochrome c oxidase subunit 3